MAAELTTFKIFVPKKHVVQTFFFPSGLEVMYHNIF